MLSIINLRQETNHWDKRLLISFKLISNDLDLPISFPKPWCLITSRRNISKTPWPLSLAHASMKNLLSCFQVTWLSIDLNKERYLIPYPPKITSLRLLLLKTSKMSLVRWTNFFTRQLIFSDREQVLVSNWAMKSLLSIMMTLSSNTLLNLQYYKSFILLSLLSKTSSLAS